MASDLSSDELVVKNQHHASPFGGRTLFPVVVKDHQRVFFLSCARSVSWLLEVPGQGSRLNRHLPTWHLVTFLPFSFRHWELLVQCLQSVTLLLNLVVPGAMYYEKGKRDGRTGGWDENVLHSSKCSCYIISWVVSWEVREDAY